MHRLQLIARIAAAPTAHRASRSDGAPTRCCAVFCRMAVMLAFFATGCATTPYRYGKFHPPGTVPEKPVIVVGEPHPTLDRVAWVIGIPDRILPMNKNINNHKLSDETAAKLEEYLQKNDLTDIYIEVNEYDPKGEWRRLSENRRVGAGWRYTLGTLSWLNYTLLPDRIFGGDYYNPYTNVLSINSDVPAIVLYEAAFAKDVHACNLPGTYAAINELPVISIWRRERAMRDVLSYSREHDDWPTEREAYCVLYPQIGIETTMIGTPFVPFLWRPVLGVGGALAGHAVGRTIAATQARYHAPKKRSLEPEHSEPELPEEVPPAEPRSVGKIQLSGYTEPDE
jgi:hypothetical protein